MVLPTAPFAFSGDETVAAVAATPRWTEVPFADQRIARLEEGLIVVACRIEARCDEDQSVALCTSTYRRRGHEDWQVVQHQQTLPLAA